MAGGRVVIGSAEYDLLLNVAPLRAAFQQAEKDAAAAAAKIDGQTKKIEGALNKVKTQQTIHLTVDTKGGAEAIKAVQARLAALKDETVNLTIKGQGADQALGKLKSDIAAVENRGITLKVKTQETLGATPRPATQQTPIKIPVTLDTRQVEAAERKLKAELESLKRQTTVPIKGDSAQAESIFARVKRAIVSLTAKPAIVKVRAEQDGRSAGSVISGIKSGLAFGAGLGGVTLGASAVHDAATSAIDSTTNLEKAQRALNVQYGESAALLDDWAKAQAAANPTQTKRAYLEAAVAVATLAKNYGATAAEQRQLIERTADIAAVLGVSLPDATKRAGDALRGEAEASELLGVSLQSDVVRATAEMTAEQRKAWETLDGTTKRQITFREFLRQTTQFQGEAQKQTSSLTQAYGAMAKAAEELGQTFGEQATPMLLDLSKATVGALEDGKELIPVILAIGQAVRDLNDIKVPDWLVGKPLADSGQKSAFEAIFGRKFGQAPPEETLIGPGGRLIDTRTAAQRESQNPTPLFGPSPEEVKAAIKAYAERAEAAKEAASKEEAIARETVNRQIKLWEEGSKAETEAFHDRIQAIQDRTAEERQAIEDKRDQDIDAVQAAADAEIQALDERKQAAGDYYASQIDAVSKQRDADIAGIEQRKETALRGIEAEKRAVEEARRGEDRQLESRREAERRSIEANTAAGERYFEQEKRGIESVRDTALRALDERAEAEDRRHSAAMRNLDDEEARQLGVIDDQLRKLDAQEEKERRAETDRGLKADRAEAQRRLKSAKTPEEKRSAKADVGRADVAIAKERRARERADVRAGLRDKQDAIRKEFDQRKRAEADKNKQVKDGIEDEKQGVQDRTKVELEALDVRLDAFKANQKAQLEALADRYKEEDQIREDARRAEDQVFDDRKQKIEDDSKAEIEGVRAAADARTEALRTAARDSDRFYDAEKRKSQDAARSKIDDIRRVAELRLRQLAAETRAMVRELNQQIKEHERTAKRMVEIWKAALQNIKGFVRAELRVQYFQDAGGSNVQSGTGAGLTNEKEGDTRTSDWRTFGGAAQGQVNIRTGEIRYAPGSGPLSPEQERDLVRTTRAALGRAIGGPVKKDQAYLVGERGPEMFTPDQDGQILDAAKTAAMMGPEPALLSAGYAAGAQRGWDGASSGASYASHAATTVNATFNIDAAGRDGESLAREIAGRLEPLLVAKAVQGTVRLLDQTEKMHAEAVDRRLGGAT